MYLPRSLISTLYVQLLRTTHSQSLPVLILVSLETDSLCACRILTALLKRDYIPHKVQPIAGYSELAKAGHDLVRPMTRQQGGEGGVTVCLGLGGLVDLEEVLGLDGGEDGEGMQDHGVEVWVVDGRRPWNLQNVFGTGVQQTHEGEDVALLHRQRGVDRGKLLSTYKIGRGGVIVWDDGDIEQELEAERDSFCALQEMPEFDDEDLGGEDSDSEEDDAIDEEPSSSQSRKRKASPDGESDSEDDMRPSRRRRSNSGTPIPSSPGGNPHSAQVIASTPPPISSRQPSPSMVIPSSPPKQPSARTLKRRLMNLRRKHQAVLEKYYSRGTSYAEPISSMLYSLASELGRDDNDLLWLAIVGVSSTELYGYSQTPSSSSTFGRRIRNRTEQIREVLRDEVRRLNPPSEADIVREREMAGHIIPTHARSPTDTSIRISPEPRFLLIRHWSLYDSMLHSPYLSTRLHIWSDTGRKRLHKLLAKMGVSLQEAGKSYVHMDMDLKRGLRERLLKFAPQYNLDGLVPGPESQEGWGFVRSWGWKACLSATDVAVIIGAILEVGTDAHIVTDVKYDPMGRLQTSYNDRIRALPTPPMSSSGEEDEQGPGASIGDPDWTTNRFFAAYDALNQTTTSSSQGLSVLLNHVPTAQHLHRAILRTGSALISKKQIRHLRAFRMGVVKEGPDVSLFCHPGALTKLAGWVSEAVGVLEAEKGRRERGALVLGCLDEGRGVYVVVGLGGGGEAQRHRTKAQLKEREEKKKRKEAEKAAKAAERTRNREERRRLRKERDAANGLLDSDDEGEESDATESASSEDSMLSSDSDSDGDDDSTGRKAKGRGLNRFGQAFQEVVEETGSRVRIDSFEHCVVEVKKEDLSGFLEALSLKSVVG